MAWWQRRWRVKTIFYKSFWCSSLFSAWLNRPSSWFTSVHYKFVYLFLFFLLGWQVPNASGVILGLIQLSLFCIYPSKPPRQQWLCNNLFMFVKLLPEVVHSCSFKSRRKIGHFLSVKDSVMFQQGVQILRVSGWEFYMTLCYFAIFRVSTPLINKNKVRCILPFVLVKIHNHQWFFGSFPSVSNLNYEWTTFYLCLVKARLCTKTNWFPCRLHKTLLLSEHFDNIDFEKAFDTLNFDFSIRPWH